MFKFMNGEKRARKWTLKTYKSAKEIEEKIKGSKMKYYIVEHDKDTDKDGTVLKRHTHLVLVFENARKGQGLGEWLEVEKNAFIEPVRDLRQIVRYLIHLDHKEKAQYSLDEMITNDNKKYIEEKYMSEYNEEEQKINDAMIIYENCERYINGEIRFKDLIKLHPNFIYQMSSLKSLIKMIEDESFRYRNKEKD